MPAIPHALPLFPLQMRLLSGKAQLYCSMRKTWLALTPEEQVRQCLVRWLLHEVGVPRAMMALERQLHYRQQPKRFDLLAFGRSGRPALLAECKAPAEPLTEETLWQACVYNSVFDAPWLLITNGAAVHLFRKPPDGSFAPVPELELYLDWP